MISFTRLTAVVGLAALAAACASVSRVVNDASDLANHQAEHVTYPSLLDIPAKPTPSTSATEHKAIVQSLQADRAEADAQTADTREQAANMHKLPVPGEPAEAPPAPAPQGATTP